MVCNLLTIPVALQYLGATRYGVWLTLTSSVSLLSCFDFGIGIGLQNRVAAMMGRDRLSESTRCIRSTLLVLAFIALLLLGAMTALIFGTDLPARAFSGAKLSGAELADVLAIVVGAFVVGLPLSLFSRIAIGLQQGWIASVSASAGTALTLVAVFIAAKVGMGFTGFVAVTVIPPFAAQLLCLAVLLWRFPGGLALVGPVSVGDGLRTLREGSRYVLPQVGALVLTQAPLVLLGTVASPIAAAMYGVFTRISLPFQQLQQMFLDQVWPAITEAMHRGDHGWLRQTLRRILRVNVAYSAVALVVVAAALLFVFPLLTRSSGLKPSTAAVILFAAHVAVMSVVQGLAYLANGLSRVRLQNCFAIVSIVFVFTALPSAAARFGMEGLLGALLALNCLVALPLLYREYATYLAQSPTNP